MSKQDEPASSASSKKSSMFELVLFYEGLLILVFVFFGLIVHNQPSALNQLSGAIIAFMVSGLISIPMGITRYRLIMYPSRESISEKWGRKRAQKDKPIAIPKHYTIGDDGQIVKLKKPRKRSRNPHQR